MLDQLYYDSIQKLMGEVLDTEKENVERAAAVIAGSIAKGGMFHIFGCGHSHIFAEEAFYRAGGLVPVNPILDSAIMLHEGALKSSAVEKMSGYASHILDRFTVSTGDVILIFSTSGVNSLPIEMAIEAKKKGMIVVVVTSLAYMCGESRHSSGKHLADFGDLVIDNHIPLGDALLEVDGIEGKIVPGSTLIGVLLLNMMIAQTAEELLRLGIEPKFLYER